MITEHEVLTICLMRVLETFLDVHPFKEENEPFECRRFLFPYFSAFFRSLLNFNVTLSFLIKYHQIKLYTLPLE